MFRLKSLRAFAVALALLSIINLSSADAAVVRHAQLPELVTLSDIVVHGIVSQTYKSEQKAFTTGIEIEILSLLKGSTNYLDAMTVQLPGGEQGQFRQILSGLPILKPGDEVVLLLERTPQGRHIFTGLSQGVYFVLRGEHRTLAIRDLGPLTLVSPQGHHVHGEDVVDKILDLTALLKRIRELVGASP